MTPEAPQWVALLYTVVLTPDRRVTSAELLTVANDLNLDEARTVLSSGNLIFRAPGAEADIAARIEAVLRQALAKDIPVLLRSEAEWRALVAANPFAQQARTDPTRVAVRLMRQDPSSEAVVQIKARCTPDEVFAVTDRALWLASVHPLSHSSVMRQIGARRVGVGTFRNASALAKITAALD